jgi:hypothetical protein
MAVEKMYISYNEIHQVHLRWPAGAPDHGWVHLRFGVLPTPPLRLAQQSIADCVDTQDVYEQFKPTLIIAIGSGGFIPARMLRTFLKAKCGEPAGGFRLVACCAATQHRPFHAPSHPSVAYMRRQVVANSDNWLGSLRRQCRDAARPCHGRGPQNAGPLRSDRQAPRPTPRTRRMWSSPLHQLQCDGHAAWRLEAEPVGNRLTGLQLQRLREARAGQQPLRWRRTTARTIVVHSPCEALRSNARREQNSCALQTPPRRCSRRAS